MNNKLQGISLMLIFAFAVCADGLMDKLGPVWFLVVASNVLGPAWYMTWRGYR